MSEHTQGRLVVRPHGGNWSASYEGYGSTAYMGIVSETGEVIALATAYSPNPFCEPAGPDENARRLVACWNACEGLPTAWIEGGAADILEHAKSLKSQRDELLAALHDVLFHIEEAMHNEVQPYEVEKAAERVRAAIAKVEASK